MTWEETIISIRTQTDFSELVEKAYLDEDLLLNVRRFMESEEFSETLRLINVNKLTGTKLLDVGSGNGISAVSFALHGFDVTAIEPDPSNTVGSGAIQILKEYYGLKNIRIIKSFAEDLNLPNETFDVIYARQCLHHAYDLNQFLITLGRLAHSGSIFFSVRDHVIFDEKDKEWFLKSHPLQKYYGGENAFTIKQYQEAILNGGFDIISKFGHFDSVINYFPMTKKEYEEQTEYFLKQIKQTWSKRLGFLVSINLFFNFLLKLKGIDQKRIFNERNIPGRLYSFLAKKKQ